jgi:hypothetical protein
MLRLQSGDLTFRSTSYQWLVISGAKAQFRGTGTVNGSGSYDFLLTATDGAAQGAGQDALRLKISSPDGVLYDNRPGGAGDDTQALDSGSIVIHK